MSRPILPSQYPLKGILSTPVVISGVCGLLFGIGIGIGFGALIFHPFYSGDIGGGIWFGKKRRKRQAKNKYTTSNDYAWKNEHENNLILKKIEQAKQLFDVD